MPPGGEELVVCVGGDITLHQEIGGAVRTVKRGLGDAVVTPCGVWHTADISASATALSITAGEGTQQRPR